MKLYFLLLLSLLCCPYSFAQEKKNGKVEIRNIDGSLSTGTNKDGKKEGKWVTTQTSGFVSEEENYHQGVHHGYYARYDKFGKPYISGNYVHGHKEGTWYLFSGKGDTTRIDNFVNDTLHGYCRIIDFTGAIFSGQVVHGKFEGVWTLEGRGGSNTLDSIHYVNNAHNGPTKRYKDGWLISECNYRDDKKDGAEIEYYGSSRQIKSITHWSDGKVTGENKEYFQDGTLKRYHYYGAAGENDIDSIWKQSDNRRFLYSASQTSATGYTTCYETYNTDGSIHYRQFSGDDWQLDSTLVYYPNGKIFQRTFFDDPKSKSREMAVVEYSVNGKIIYKGRHNGGRSEGVCTSYDSISGKKQKQITYVSGRTEGRYTNYYPNGKIEVIGVCHADYLRDSIRVYSSTGVLLTKGTQQYTDVLNRVLLEDPELNYKDPDLVMEEDNQDVMIGEATIEEGPIEEPDEQQIFVFAETMPSFPGDTLANYFSSHIQYPAIERANGKDGTVYVQFVVETDGLVTNVKVAKGVPGAPGLSNEAVRMISAMPKWNPGKMNGRPVRVQMITPVRFVLQ